jgi:hypothetical protein
MAAGRGSTPTLAAPWRPPRWVTQIGWSSYRSGPRPDSPPYSPAGSTSGGICAKEGERVTFMRFVRYGLPITLVKLILGALHVLALSAFVG